MSRAKRSGPSICFKVTSEETSKFDSRDQFVDAGKLILRWPGKGGIEEAPATRFDDHLGARKPLFGFAARSAFSTRMASSTKSRS
jgi:hypothetical protein